MVLHREAVRSPANATESDALGPAEARAGEGGRERYSHLIDPGELVRKRADKEGDPEGNAWTAVLRSVPEVYRRYENAFTLETAVGALAPVTRVTEEQFEAGLANTWFTVEERIKEFLGTIELVHSLYYSNPDITEIIARFLASRSGPHLTFGATENGGASSFPQSGGTAHSPESSTGH